MTSDYVDMANSPPAPLQTPIAQYGLLLWALDDRVPPPAPTQEGLADARKAIGKGQNSMQLVVKSQSLAGGAATSAGAAILGAEMANTFDYSTKVMNAIGESGPSNKLVIFLRRQSNQSIKPAVIMMSSDAYLILEDETIVHSHREMSEFVYLGASNIPDTVPQGMTQVLPDNYNKLMKTEVLDHPEYPHSVVTRQAIADVAAKLAARG